MNIFSRPVSFTTTGMAALRSSTPLAMSELPAVRDDLP